MFSAIGPRANGDSDTTASTFTFMFYHLARDTNMQEKLRKELVSLRESDRSFSFKSLQSADLLNAIINETLRLHPPVPSGALRLTPPEGIKIGETFIPGNTTVVAPSYSIGRRELTSNTAKGILTYKLSRELLRESR
jgi:tryprostatin B 6-hydroxylase